MNEKFSFFTSMVFAFIIPISQQAEQISKELGALRASFFYETHPQLPWESSKGWLGFRRESDGKFYKLQPQEKSDA